MYRFASRAFKLCVPAALVLYTIKPIFNKDQAQEILRSTLKSQINIPEFLQNTALQQITNQAKEEPTTGNAQSNTESSQEQKQQKNSQEKINDDQNVGTNQVILGQQNLQIKQEQINYLEYAQVSPQTPPLIQNYLQMQGIKVIIKNESAPNSILIKNKAGDRVTFHTSEYVDNPHLLFQISNFITPIRVISTQEQISTIFKNLPEDEYLIASFIPTEEDYKHSKQPKSFLDSFTASQNVEINKIEQSFRKQKYASGSNKNNFIIVRNPQIAKTMKINVNKIGTQYVYYKTSPNQGMETSALLAGIKYTIKSVPMSAQKNPVSAGLYSFVNEINFEGDLQNFMRSLKLKKENRKLLVVYSKQRRPQFLKQVKSITLKAAKMMREQVVVLVTDNPNLLVQYFQIVPDDFVTIRLINLNKYQQPVVSIPGFGSDKKFYSRKVMNGPFTVQNLCRFIKNQEQWKQYYERKKKLVTIPSIISLNEQIPNNTTVLHWKHGCKGCQLTSDYLQHIKTTIQNLDQQKIYDYQIQNPSLLKSIQFRKFNILNQQQTKSPKDHDVTPKLILHTNGIRKDLQIGEIIGKISKINYQNQNEIHKIIMKEIIQAITRAIEQSHQNFT